MRIADLLTSFPASRETKIDKLLRGLGALWSNNQEEKIVIFATYLGTVELLAREIEAAYPGQGVVVLKGGDHGSKLAAERRFRKTDGPRVLVCTAAGREGINLQFARVLFNFDLPWNPMDVEQRIGRIHRYGQKDTAQVYNLVLSDTIEGKIFLLLTDKLEEIAKTLGKVDSKGNVAEDLRSQILGQLTDRVSYDQLYREALSDPELKRTTQELEAAMANAHEARQVVFELFQDLDSFSLDDYSPLSNVDEGMQRISRFYQQAVSLDHSNITQMSETDFRVNGDNLNPVTFTMDRDKATADDSLALVGLDHPLVKEKMDYWGSLIPSHVGSAVRMDVAEQTILTIWHVQSFESQRGAGSYVIPIAISTEGQRVPSVEKQYQRCFEAESVQPLLSIDERLQITNDKIDEVLKRELIHRGIASPDKGFSANMLSWLEIIPII